jgi:hypothetical protein
MSDPTSRHDEDPLDGVEELEAETAALLRARRPVPAPSFRGDLRRRLESGATEISSEYRASLPIRIAGLAGVGSLLLAIAALGLAGVPPFGA